MLIISKQLFLNCAVLHISVRFIYKRFQIKTRFCWRNKKNYEILFCLRVENLLNTLHFRIQDFYPPLMLLSEENFILASDIGLYN